MTVKKINLHLNCLLVSNTFRFWKVLTFFILRASLKDKHLAWVQKKLLLSLPLDQDCYKESPPIFPKPMPGTGECAVITKLVGIPYKMDSIET